MLSQTLIIITILIICILGYASGQPTLPPHEVEALKAIGRILGMRDSDIPVDPCKPWPGPNLNTNTVNEEVEKKSVTCNCTFESNTSCHVISIVLRGQNLSGSVGVNLAGLPFLQQIDLTRNYLTGTIPPQWGSMKLVNISLFGNRITGSIPADLGNITTLANLTLEYNQLSGTIPPAIGKLPRLESLLLSSNNLTGEIPPSLANLTTLRNFSISDNNFTGPIPKFIQKWTNIEKLLIQGSGLSGPIPPSIASLTKLIDLRISDLSGNESTFPPFSNRTKKLEKLVLRSCKITGKLPPDIGYMTTLKVLDLSFNKLYGPIPDSFSKQDQTDYIYLTGNSLSGQLPGWMQTEGESIDLSYNNLTSEPLDTCQTRNLNLFASSKGHTSGIVSCLRDHSRCEKNFSSLYINCGGNEVAVNKRTTFEWDTDPGGPTYFYRSNSNWRFSSTGHFMDDRQSTEAFIASTRLSISGQDSQLYKNARLSPLSLTYYAFCMMNGNYTVNLYFAEIMLSNDSTYLGLGRRVFDVYVQGKLVLKDFNIANAAGGVNVGIKRSFTAIVDDRTLDIRFYWAGKGTSYLTVKGVYGPLISAISVTPNFTPPSENGNTITAGAIVGIVMAVLSIVVLVLAILWWKGCFGLKLKYSRRRDLKGLDLQTGSFSLRQIKAATDNFNPANKIGEGGFGPVYKGHLLDGTIIAVKQLSSKSKQGNREFVNEIGMISALQHPHLVKLYGSCIEGNQLLLVYEYMENNSLAHALFGSEEQQLHLDWPTRHKISIGIARGLAYLHEESRLKIVHRDIKATNVLLDKNLDAKISDFGLARLDDEDDTHISTRIAGTYGYMAPEYATRGHLTDKADVYSFGVVLLEIINGRSNTSIRTKDASFYLLDWANSLKEKENLLELVDSRIESNFNKREVMAAINVALQCTNDVAAERPSMSTVVSILEGKDSGIEDVSSSGVPNDKMNLEDTSMDVSSLGVDITVPWTGSTATSSGDLYPTLLNTDYWKKRDS